MNDWHSRIQRSQQLAKAIADSGRQSVYVNPHLGLEYRRPYALDPHSRIAQLGPRLFEFHIHLPREHALDQRPHTARESSRIVRELARLVETAGVSEASVIVSFPSWIEAASEIRRRYGFPIVYDCHDWLPGFGRLSPEFLELENDLFRMADLVVFSSQVLQDRVLKKHPACPKSVLIRNAADRPDTPAQAVNTPRPPTIGYVGALDHWFDIAAVAAVARDHPGWRVVLAGRVEDARILELRKFPNVAFPGEIPRAELALLLSGWDAAMIPFLVNDLTLATNPIKLYEYFGAGLPVVSSRLPEVELYAELVYLADTPAAFSAVAENAMRESEASLRQRRILAARQETWSARAERLLESIAALPVA